MEQTLTWRVPGGPLRTVCGHEDVIQELFTLLVTAGVTDIEVGPEIDAELVPGPSRLGDPRLGDATGHLH